MKQLCCFLVVGAVLLSACGEPVMPASYTVRLPALPEAWGTVLGAPLWELRYVDAAGGITTVRTGADSAEIMPLQEWPGAILALPAFPDRALPAGILKPAGALFPLDAGGGDIRLSWAAGVDAFFYFELAKAGAEKRCPAYFDWGRFRSLFTEGQLEAEILADPWLADWPLVARKTAASGWDKRRIKTPALGSVTMTPPADGLWFGDSPFTEAKNWKAGTELVLPRRGEVDTWFCAKGLLRLNGKAAVWKEWEQ
jgi:hypothetical protein